jgi:hypothetical protein
MQLVFCNIGIKKKSEKGSISTNLRESWAMARSTSSWPSSPSAAFLAFCRAFLSFFCWDIWAGSIVTGAIVVAGAGVDVGGSEEGPVTSTVDVGAATAEGFFFFFCQSRTVREGRKMIICQNIPSCSLSSYLRQLGHCRPPRLRAPMRCHPLEEAALEESYQMSTFICLSHSIHHALTAAKLAACDLGLEVDKGSISATSFSSPALGCGIPAGDPLRASNSSSSRCCRLLRRGGIFR